MLQAVELTRRIRYYVLFIRNNERKVFVITPPHDHITKDCVAKTRHALILVGSEA